MFRHGVAISHSNPLTSPPPPPWECDICRGCIVCAPDKINCNLRWRSPLSPGFFPVDLRLHVYNILQSKRKKRKVWEFYRAAFDRLSLWTMDWLTWLREKSRRKDDKYFPSISHQSSERRQWKRGARLKFNVVFVQRLCVPWPPPRTQSRHTIVRCGKSQITAVIIPNDFPTGTVRKVLPAKLHSTRRSVGRKNTRLLILLNKSEERRHYAIRAFGKKHEKTVEEFFQRFKIVHFSNQPTSNSMSKIWPLCVLGMDVFWLWPNG